MDTTHRTYRLSRSELASALLVTALFVVALVAAQLLREPLQHISLAHGPWGMLVYVALAILATVVAPISTVPLIPLASALWGPLATALLSIVGWTLGALIAFLIAERYGRPLVGRFVALERVDAIAHMLLGTTPFWSILVARMLLPVDLLSYAIGLFVPVSFTTYTFATLLGVAPFAFLFAYTSTLPLWAQAVTIVGALLVFLAGYVRVRAHRAHTPPAIPTPTATDGLDDDPGGIL
jgi:uncharacterized membrane protein YdjX (TVP38/TMEM64 family)